MNSPKKPTLPELHLRSSSLSTELPVWDLGCDRVLEAAWNAQVKLKSKPGPNPKKDLGV